MVATNMAKGSTNGMTRLSPAAERLPDGADGALVQMRAFIAQGSYAPDDRLPPERELCRMLGVGRAQLRKAFAVLEAEGLIWRHVGRGTFIGDGTRPGSRDSVGAIAKRTSPREVMHARLVLEPQLAREAALHATLADLDELRAIDRRSRVAANWREYETTDNALHRSIAVASQCAPLIALFDQLNALRRTVVWGRLRTRRERPQPDHHSFGEHGRIIAAIAERDGEAAEREMRTHLKSVAARLFPY